ncbi:hypothetical protein ACNSTU_15640 [Aquisalimonas sp. APHAB1-3]|uniref:hypothetical protein n=1 Tax=Aquisalimonas sp. APHAB1-3 TaxID=3402080 RepID=UPI003AABD8C0
MKAYHSTLSIAAKLLVTASAAGLLAGCFGSSSSSSSSGGGDDDTSTPTIQFDTGEGTERTGQFVDAPVEGLGYTAPSLNEKKYTGSDGGLEYKRGELVTLYLGDIILGSTVGGEYMTPMNIIPSGGGEHAPLNLVRLLQSLDISGAQDRIQLPAGVGENLDADPSDLDLSQEPAEFAQSEIVKELLDGRSLVPEEEAVRHLNTTMEDLDWAVDMRGTTWRFVSTSTAEECAGKVGEATITYLDDGMKLEGGTIEFRDGKCVVETWEEREETEASYEELNDLVDFCGPVCTFGDLNHYARGEDHDDGNSAVMVSHVPGSGVFTYTSHGVMNGEPYELHENRAIEREVDLSGTWNSVTTTSRCEGAELHATYTISEDKVEFNGDAEFDYDECKSAKPEGHTWQFSDSDDVEKIEEAAPWAAQGASQQLAWLNRSYVRTEDAGDGRAQVLRIAYTPAEPDTINVLIEADNVTEYQTLERQ